jgi:murein DD-endopeptidase MepM/ murein hydrolase activator NlpD
MTTVPLRRRAFAVLAALALIFGLVVVITPSADASHTFTQSDGIYRIPYQNGSNVTVSNDHHDHSPSQDRIDMWVGKGTPIVAAASGWIRAVVDFNGGTPNAGDGVATDGTPQADSLEENCSGGNKTVVGSCADYNNYVWIEHPNGEWSKYSHVGTGTASDHLTVGDWINAGELIGLEGDIGAASGSHLHWEVGVPTDPTDSTPFSTLGGFFQGTNVVGRICDIVGNLFVTGQSYTAAACVNQTPTADAGGPYEVDEGSDIQLDGTGSSDPDGGPLTYAWEPGTNLDDATLAQPTYSGIDDVVADPITLTVYDQIEAHPDDDSTSVTVLNVAPSVDADGDTIDEGDAASVSVSFTDPGVLDTHTATIDWDDGTPFEVVAVVQGAGSGSLQGSRTFSDNGLHDVEVVVTDDDGGVGSDTATVTVLNVAPTVAAVGDSIDEGGTASVSATFTDPGVLDTHTATIDWDDGSPAEVVEVVQGEGLGSLGAEHVYGDNGAYNVEVTVTDNDGGVGLDIVAVLVANVDPELTLDAGDATSFPGGDYFVGKIGELQNHAASANDPGSDDLTFTWNFGPATTYFNDGINPDPPKSPHGVFPFFATNDADVDFVLPGAYVIDVTVTDDDGGSDQESLGKVITGDAETTEGNGWWKHQYNGEGNLHVDDAVLHGYLDIVNAVSSVFSEATNVATLDDVHNVLSPDGDDRRVHAEADLMAAWLHFASGAVAWDASVPLEGGTTLAFLDVMLQIEATILDAGATDMELLEVELLAQRVRHAG